MVMRGKENGLSYLEQYPQLNKWINRCICCGSIGYKPNLPESLTANSSRGEYKTAGATNLRKYFQPFTVNELSICEICQKHI